MTRPHPELGQRPFIALAFAVGLTVILGACGGGNSVNSAGGRTIDIDMRDNDFSRASLQVKAGEVVQFVFHNKGAVAHDAYIGDDAAQMTHAQRMTASDGVSHGGQGSDEIFVEPGQSATLTHTFGTAGTTIIGCHQQDHYVLGMRIRVTVT